ncbi:MAG TPA: methyltransferase domain-containing protein [Miltoncostaeaceae bacterium]|nr:methyltransferase domain-containing protein [Miltoncostaeaceae bacterium]
MGDRQVGQRYAIAGGLDGKRRLDLLAEIMRPTTLALLERVGVAAGHRCLDLGCGGGHVAIDMARIAGATGRVVGVDFDARVVELARADAAEAGVGCEFLAEDCLAGRGGVEAGFDVCYARFLLSHVSDPPAVLARMRALARPGGMVVVEDIDFSGFFCEPPDPAHDEYARLYAEAVALSGGDAAIGRSLPGLVAAAGLADVELCVCQPAHMAGPLKLLNQVTMERIRPRVVDGGLATDAEVDAVVAGMGAFCEREGTLVALPRIVQAWGRRPPSAEEPVPRG